MFQTDFNHFLQGFENSALTSFLEGVSILGTTYLILFVVLIVISGVDFKKGIILVNIVGWSALFTVGTKALFDYPRPHAVDATLNSFGREITLTDYSSLQPTGFFKLFSPELLSIIRSSDIGRHGFPSGHVLLITTLWLGLSLLFRNKALWVISIALILLTMISRSYLGVHYLGDVLGGLAFAIMLVYIIHQLIIRANLQTSQKINRGLKIMLFVPIILLLLSSFLPGFQAGSLIGLNLAYLLIVRHDVSPELSDRYYKRILNGILFVTLYFAMYVGMRLLPIPESGILSILAYAVANFLVLLMFYALGTKLRVYLKSSN